MKKLVVLTGAGISAESGLKTFRGNDGLWEGYAVEEVATPGGWRRNPAQVLEFYNLRRRQIIAARPNQAHYGLARLETSFEVHIITQNIDDLHERAGSTRVLHLHGEILKMHSEWNPELVYPIQEDIDLGDLAADGGQLRPAIVWFEEPVPMMEIAVPLVASADYFAVIGSSLVVYPAAGLIHCAPASIPKFLIDPGTPEITAIANLTTIRQPASVGVATMERLLNLVI